MKISFGKVISLWLGATLLCVAERHGLGGIERRLARAAQGR
jgi:hypothetical protein